MPLGTLDSTPPPFFHQGPSALSRLVLFSLLAIFLMAADARFHMVQPLRLGMATALYPLQWLAMRPMLWLRRGGAYFEALSTAQMQVYATQRKLLSQSQRANQVEQLTLENTRLRVLLGLRERLETGATAAQVLYEAADIYTHKVVIDRGSVDHLQNGSPVVDESGVLGQVTRVYPLLSEVTLVNDREQAIPVLNVRTGARAIAFGDPNAHDGGLELRFMAANADVLVGDLLTTSEVDGVYPPGLPVAKVTQVERRVGSAFARITCRPVAQVAAAEHVMVLHALNAPIAPRPVPEVAVPAAKEEAHK